MSKKKRKTLSETLIDAALDLDLGKATADKIESLGIPEVEEFSPDDIRSLRERENVSQGVFAVYLNVSPSTVHKWEKGEVRPQNAALRLLSIINSKGLEAISDDE